MKDIRQDYLRKSLFSGFAGGLLRRAKSLWL
jgi:hypothetical protein